VTENFEFFLKTKQGLYVLVGLVFSEGVRVGPRHVKRRHILSPMWLVDGTVGVLGLP